MKIFLGTCVWGGVAQELQTAGQDVVWAGERGDQLTRKGRIGIVHLISLRETFIGSINYWFTLPQSNFSTNVPSLMANLLKLVNALPKHFSEVRGFEGRDRAAFDGMYISDG